MKTSFVILHYQNIEITQQCVEYLQKLYGYPDFNIIIVDNASPDKSGEVLLEMYNDLNNVFVLCNHSNLGFANGNNVGYKFAKEQLNTDVVIVMNNDVFIKQIDFIKQLEKINTDFSVQLIAPDIVNLNGFHQNPFRLESLSNKRLKYIYRYNVTLKFLYEVPIMNLIISKILQYRTRRREKDFNEPSTVTDNFVPHGSCLIFLSSWIKKEDFAFLPDTFMYFEEDILFEYLLKMQYSIKYCPELSVQHLEDASVNASKKTELKKRRFIASNLARSIKILIDMRNEKSNS
jgi:GT2 family glycosyltransferase